MTASNRLTVVGGSARTAPPPPPPDPPLDGPRTGPERAPAATSWRGLRGDAGRTSAVANEAIETPLEKRWVVDVGGKVHRVAAQAGRMFVSYHPGPGEGTWHRALDMRDGSLLWGPIRIDATLFLDGGRAYYYGYDGRFHGLDTRTGLETFTSGLAPGGGPGHIVATGGRVYSADAHLVAADVGTGAVSTAPNAGSDTDIAVGAGLVVTADACSGTRTYDAATLAPRWNRASNCYFGAPPTVAGGSVYSDFKLDAQYRHDAATGAVTATRFLHTVPAVAGNVSVALTGYGIAAWDETTGERLWATHDDGSLFGTPVVANGLAFVQSRHGAVHAYDLADGRLRWTDPGVGETQDFPCCWLPAGLGVAQSQLVVPAGTKVALYGPSDIPPPAPDFVVPTLEITSGPAEGAWSGRSVTFEFATSAPAATYSCEVDGAVRPCGESLTLTGLAPGNHTLVVSALTSNGPTHEVRRTWRVDAAPPVATVARPASPWSLTFRAAASWGASDSGSGVATYDVRVRAAAPTSDLGGWTYPAGLQGTTARSTGFALSPGRTLCWAARARDRAGNAGGWSGMACQTAPLDDRAFGGSGWSRTDAAGWYRGTVTTTRTRGAVLSASSLRVRRIGLVALRCPSCGAVRLRWNARSSRRSTSAPPRRHAR